jgi:hypothetical protein
MKEYKIMVIHPLFRIFRSNNGWLNLNFVNLFSIIILKCLKQSSFFLFSDITLSNVFIDFEINIF